MASGPRRRRHHRRRRPAGGLGAGGVAVLALVLVPAAAAGGWSLRPRQCESTWVVQVATVPGFLPVLNATRGRLAQPDRDRRCVAVDARLRRGADLAAEIGRRAGIGLGSDLPDVWIPDSSRWLAPARRSPSGVARLPRRSPSLASSPVVVALPRTMASELGWPRVQPGWRVARGGNGPGLADPSDATAGLLALLAVANADQREPAGAVAALASQVVVPRLPSGSPSAVVGTGGVAAIPTSEQDVVLHNRRAPDAPVAAVYDASLAGALDFPFVRVASGRRDAAPGWAVTALQDALAETPAVDAARKAGLRTAAGDPLPEGAPGALPVRVRAPPPAADGQVRDLLAAWRTLGRRSRALLVLQTSASMRDGAPGTGRSRLALATAAADAVVRSSPPDADLGLWTFSSEPGGRAGHTVQVPVGPLFDRVGDRSRRDALLGALSAVSARAGTGSGINTTVLDGFRMMERGFVYGRLNTVLVVTDGTADPGGTSQATLLRRLREEFDGVAPVRVITVAYGATDGARLIEVSDVTGGRSFSAVTPEQVPDLMREALSEL